MPVLYIEINFEDETDMGFMRSRLVDSVEDTLDEQKERFDGDYQVDWTIEDKPRKDGGGW